MREIFANYILPIRLNKNYLFDSISNFKIKKISILKKINELLKILVEGCKIHPAYSVRRKATERCAECDLAWKARLELNGLEECKI